MPNQGLSVSDVVGVDVFLTPTAAQQRNFGSLLVLGDSSVIDVEERLRLYTDLDAIGADFGESAPEYEAADVFFEQNPQPAQIYIGRWAATATSATLRGGILSAAQQSLTNFTGISNGSLQITIGGTTYQLTSLNFTGATNLNGVAATLQGALSTAATVEWDANNGNFWIFSTNLGALATIGFASPQGSGQDVSALLALTSATAQYVVQGISPETIETGVNTLLDLSNLWYGLQIASTAEVADADAVTVGEIIEGQTISHIMGITTAETGVLSTESNSDLASLLNAVRLKRVFCQYSSETPFASASALGRAFTVNFEGSNTTITLDFQQEPGVNVEFLTETQNAALLAKKANVFVEYDNNTAILQPGVMSDGTFFDIVHGTDWLQNALQTALWNLFYTAGTKIPQTDAGVGREIATCTVVMEQSVANGLVAPGVWNGPAVGALVPGQTLTKGYYIYAPPIATQTQADRAARKSPVLQIAMKLAGAIQDVDVIVNVNP